MDRGDRPQFVALLVTIGRNTAHEWSELIFLRLEGCIGQVIEMDEETRSMRRVDAARLQVQCDLQRRIPRVVALDCQRITERAMVRRRKMESMLSQ